MQLGYWVRVYGIWKKLKGFILFRQILLQIQYRWAFWVTTFKRPDRGEVADLENSNQITSAACYMTGIKWIKSFWKNTQKPYRILLRVCYRIHYRVNCHPGLKSHEISLKNLLTIHAEDMKLIVDAILRWSHHEFFLRSLEDLL